MSRLIVRSAQPAHVVVRVRLPGALRRRAMSPMWLASIMGQCNLKCSRIKLTCCERSCKALHPWRVTRKGRTRRPCVVGATNRHGCVHTGLSGPDWQEPDAHGPTAEVDVAQSVDHGQPCVCNYNAWQRRMPLSHGHLCRLNCWRSLVQLAQHVMIPPSERFVTLHTQV
jgi:hypothetical protein